MGSTVTVRKRWYKKVGWWYLVKALTHET
ncbi:uncharacterized protein G2W53_023958 [Senna tora]|uniref:Uncharacterized protein n=1 Tax=Senna tora TaxID=362788 RepID=A0A834TAE2_9FABA|nr:uncharacterized protein G2W53_023958 [Senna tora]